MAPDERWRNPFLAHSEYAIAHGFCDQRDSTDLSGPLPDIEDKNKILDENDCQYKWLGPGPVSYTHLTLPTTPYV